jgi:membrane-associated phospholipid phosphatase
MKGLAEHPGGDAEKRRRAAYISLLTVILAILVFSEYTGMLDHLNLLAYQALPHGDWLPIKIISLSASMEATAIYLVLLVAIDLARTRRIGVLTASLITSLILAMILVLVLKIWIQAPRPREAAAHYPFLQALQAYDTFAFPSGHTARATILAYYASKNRRTPAKLLAWLWALTVALTRLLLAKHWLSDILASLTIGTLIPLTIDPAIRKWLNRQSAKL